MDDFKPDVTISSLAEYIDVVKNFNLNGSYLRGEHKRFPRITSSLLRDYTPSHNERGVIDKYSQLLREYYNEIGSELDDLQFNNFLAFSQHHGLKTNLLDFTTAPLVALFFACDNVLNDDGSGYVYIINRHNAVDASSFLEKHSLDNYIFNNFLKLIEQEDMSAIDDFYHIIECYAGLNSDCSPVSLVTKFMETINNTPQLEISNRYLNDRKQLAKQGLDSFLDGFTNLLKTYFSKINILNKNLHTLEYIVMMYLYLNDLNTLHIFSDNILDVQFPPMPYLVYKTPLKFDRIRNQSGVFIYQPFIDYKTSDYEVDGLAFQKIVPDFTIEIKKQNSVMNELDALGINRRFIYGDFDNTAKYINSKYFN